MVIHQIKRDATAFQQPVNEQALSKQLRHELAGENIIDISELAAGQFNNTYRINTSRNAYVLKVAPAADAGVFYNERRLMQREHTLSPHLQSASPLVPEYLSFFTIGNRDAFLQPWIEGSLWHDIENSLSGEENASLWTQLGTFARTIHNIHGVQFGYPDPCEGFDRWSEFIADNVAGMVEDCRRLNVMCNEIQEYIERLPRFYSALDTAGTARLLHGDLWPRNVIIDGAGKDIHIKAVIDGERAFWGDPACDWVLILYGVPAAFWDGYGECLPDSRDPACIAVYKGMYFILNILEATRFPDTVQTPRTWLAGINRELASYQ